MFFRMVLLMMNVVDTSERRKRFQTRKFQLSLSAKRTVPTYTRGVQKVRSLIQLTTEYEHDI